MSAKHTPGVWVAHKCGPINGGFEVWASGCRVADVVRESDARLIVAAPDLLAALTSLMGATDYFSGDDDMVEALNEARAALAKAKGGAK